MIMIVIVMFVIIILIKIIIIVNKYKIEYNLIQLSLMRGSPVNLKFGNQSAHAESTSLNECCTLTSQISGQKFSCSNNRSIIHIYLDTLAGN